nr:hypothetical protein [Planctomycetota bacterium]
MDAAIVVDDAHGTGAALVGWLTGFGCPGTVVANVEEAEATVAYQQLAGATRLFVFAALTAANATFFQSLRASAPAVLRGFYTRTPARDHDAALIGQHGLVAILHQPFASESPEALGLSGKTASPPASPTPGSHQTIAELPESPPPAIQVSAAQHGTTVAPSAREQHAKSPAKVAMADARADAPLDRRRALWVVVLEDHPGCCRAICEELAVPSVMVKIMETWQEASDLALHALTPGLVIGPMCSDAVRLCRRLNEVGNSSQVILYTESQSQSQ